MKLAAAIALAAVGCSAPALAPHEITAPGELLTSDGRLMEPGWSRRQLLHWDPTRVHDAAKLRQWDFFTVSDDRAAVNLTLVDLGFVQLCSVGVVDLASGEKHDASLFKAAGDQFTLSGAVEGSASLSAQGAAGPAMSFVTTADTSTVAIDIPSSLLGEAAKGAFTIHRRPAMPYLSVATPFREDPHQFFYEQKIPGMSAEGMVTVGAKSWTFAAASSAAIMDWGRGQWPSSATWRWGGASGSVGGASVAFNLGEGFGDASAATENLVVEGDVANKLAAVEWAHDANDLMKDWTFHAPDGRVELVLHPLAQEAGGVDFGAKYSRLKKVYGRYTGTIRLDDGRTIRVDGMPGFAEEMELAW